ncbi:MAG TPA: hypothetical protein VFI31_24195 [Pirellulales bacterium]|nr:hypothetical protein [Pirellulales bacterium]
MPSSRWLLALVIRLSAIAAVGLQPAVAGESSTETSATSIGRLIAELNDDDFDVRQQASEKLADLARQPRHREELAGAVRASLNGPGLGYEARRQLERLSRDLPPAKVAAAPEVTDDELDRLVAGLDGDTYADRIGAAAQLASLAERPGLACRISERLRPIRRMPTLSRQTRERVEPLWERAQLAWLSSDPAAWQWSPVEQEQIEHWLDLLTRPLPPQAETASREETRARLERKRRLAGRDVAKEELLALLARDDQTARTKAAIDQRLAGGRIDDEARRLLRELADWTLPWLAIEIWTEAKLTSVLELIVGVPFQVPMAPRPTLFDRIDGRQAHCVSDAVLRPGDYPVGVLFPHPSPIRSDAQLVLYHLPTPRARLAYHYRLKGDRDRRFPELSERTLVRLAGEKRPLKQAEFVMLASLEPHAVSRFAAKYLATVGDPTPVDKLREEHAGRGSPHSSLCNMLVEIGTHEAVPGILEAIRTGKLAKPADPSSPNWPWVAVLTILASDPGPDADRILPVLIPRTDPLVAGDKVQSDVGATAAAILVDLHGLPVEKFGLELVDDSMLSEYGGIGYRFNPPEMRLKVLAWWKEQQAAGKSASGRKAP